MRTVFPGVKEAIATPTGLIELSRYAQVHES